MEEGCQAGAPVTLDLNMRFALLALLVLSASASAQNVWYVDSQAAPPGNGTAATPYKSIQFAIFQAGVVDGDQLHLAPGTYNEPISLSNKRLEIIGTGGPEVTIIDGGGPARAVSGAGSNTNGSRIEGLTLTNGGGTPGVWGTFPTLPGGGGLFVESTTLTVFDCVITGNEFLGVGGGCFVRDASLIIKDSSFVDNGVYFWSQIQDGGAIFSQDSTVVLSGCLLDNNNTYASAGAIRQRGGALRLETCTFRDNAAGFADGGAVLVWETLTVIEDCIFDHNLALDLGAGGALACWASDVTVDDCTFTRNEGDDGGAIYSTGSILDVMTSQFDRNSSWEYDPVGFAGRGGAIALGGFSPGSVLIETSTFTNNVAEGSPAFPGLGVGGAIYGPALVDRCTFYGNEAYDEDGAVSGSDVANSILWNNIPNEAGSGATIRYSDVQGGYLGTGNLDADPLFWLADEGDLHLRTGSPAVDAGDPGTMLDRDGSLVDMGAYTWNGDYRPPTITYCVPKTTFSGCVPTVSSTGTPSMGDSTMVVTCSNIDSDRFGLLIWGMAPTVQPLFGGTLCVGQPFVRSGILHSGYEPGPCSGQFSFAFTSAYMGSEGMFGGDVIYTQFYFRDPGSLEQAGTSDALRFTVAP